MSLVVSMQRTSKAKDGLAYLWEGINRRKKAVNNIRADVTNYDRGHLCRRQYAIYHDSRFNLGPTPAKPISLIYYWFTVVEYLRCIQVNETRKFWEFRRKYVSAANFVWFLYVMARRFTDAQPNFVANVLLIFRIHGSCEPLRPVICMASFIMPPPP